MTVTAVTSTDLRARLAVGLVFIVLGGTQGGWMARIPAIRDQVGVDTARWGLLSSSSAAGDVVAIVLITLLIGRVSTRLLALATVVLLNAPVLAGASSVPALVLGLTTWGVGATFLAHARERTRRRGRARPRPPTDVRLPRLLQRGRAGGRCHGHPRRGHGRHSGHPDMAISSGVLGTLLLILGARLPRDAPTHKERHRPLKHRFTPQLVLLAGIAFLGSFAEGAASQWSSVYTADYLDEGSALGAATYTSFTVAILAGRLVGDRFVARLGRRAFLRLSLLTSALGVTVVVVRPAVWLALAGFVVVGLGVACVLPSVIALAGRQPGVPAGEGVSVITIGQWPGFLLAGPAVGLLAGATSLRVALAALIVAGLVAAVLAGRVVVPGTG